MKLFSTSTTTVVVALAALAVSPASSSLNPPEYNSLLPKLDTEKMRADFLSLISPHHQRMLQGGELYEPELSLKCEHSFDILRRNAMSTPLPPDLVGAGPPPPDAETNTIDFAADQDLLDAFDSYCNSLGGQTVLFDYEFSDGCNFIASRILNQPECFGSACDEDDIEETGILRASIFTANDNSCTVSFTAGEPDGDGEPFGPPCITNEYLDDSFIYIILMMCTAKTGR